MWPIPYSYRCIKYYEDFIPCLHILLLVSLVNFVYDNEKIFCNCIYLITFVGRFRYSCCSNNFTSLIMYEFFFSNFSTMQIYELYRVRFIWAPSFLHILFHMRAAVVYAKTLKSVNEYSSWINAFLFPQMQYLSVLYNLWLYPSLSLVLAPIFVVSFKCIRVFIQHNSRELSCHYHRRHWKR